MTMQKITLTLAVVCALFSSACGLKGDLYIEEPVIEESAPEAAAEVTEPDPVDADAVTAE